MFCEFWFPKNKHTLVAHSGALNKVPTDEYKNVLYPKFGVASYHEAGNFGAGVSLYIIDIGLTNLSFKKVKSRTITNAMAPKNTHGSFVTSILATPRNATGLHGIVPDAQIYIADVSDSDGLVYTTNLVSAIKDATALKVDIISISMGTGVFDAALERAVSAAANEGIVVLAAAGNCGCRAYEFPSSCAAAISVGSIDINRNKSVFNTQNDYVSVFAPGQNIGIPGSKARLSGTSFAVPFASGLLALELSRLRHSESMAKLDKLQSVNFLRTALGLNCDDHTYANQVCTGSLAPPKGHDALLWFIILAAVSGIFFLGKIYFK
jgi:subtilisin family serine protease